MAKSVVMKNRSPAASLASPALEVIELPLRVAARIRQKRGNALIYQHFEASRTALLVIDMQRYYGDKIAGIAHITPRVQSLCDSLRHSGAQVVWLFNTLERNGVDLWPAYHERFFSPQTAAAHRAGLASGTAGHSLLSGLTPHANDWQIEKTRFSAFAPASSSLAAQLEARGIDNLVITGVATNVCCESTARDAMMRDYRVAVVADAMAAVTHHDHVNGLATLASCFADVRTAQSVEQQLLR